MDTYGHLFPSRERGWADKLDDEGWRGEPAPSAHPAEKISEQLSPKSLDLFGGGDPDRTGDPRLMRTIR